MWVARYKDWDCVTLFLTKPFRDGDYWFTEEDESLDLQEINLPINLFPELKWEDEPIEVDLIETFRLQSLRAIK